MKRILLVLTLAAMALTASSQKVYFMYLQAEPAQPFYVKMNGKVYSSSVSGYLILPKLLDTTYSINLDFIQNKVPEQTFTVKMAQKDHGFLVKDFGEKGWGLFDLQSLAIQYSSTVQVKTDNSNAQNNKEVSPFTDLLAKATGDPSLRENPPVPKVEEKPVIKPEAVVVEQAKPAEPKPVLVEQSKEPVTNPPAETGKVVVEKREEAIPVTKVPEQVKPEPVVVKEEKKEEVKSVVKEPESKPVEPVLVQETKPVVAEKSKEVLPEIKKEEPKAVIEEKAPVKTEEAPVVVPEYKRSVVTKRSESSTTEGFGLVFMDNQEGVKIDTIRLLIPNPKVIVPVVKEQPKEEKKFLDIQATAVKPEDKPVVTEEKSRVTEPVKPAEQTKTEEKPVSVEKPAEKPAATLPCAEVAAEADFFALRKAMAAAEGDDDMISQAKKYFKLKCFSVPQIKNLGALFLNDESKYNFFDAAYKYATDKTAFATLETELKDPYYINRFKAMLH
jgi:hypothetical protein